MTVSKRKSSKGISKYYTYRFMLHGGLYYGSCYLENSKGEKVKCTTQREALQAEQKAKDFQLTLHKHKTEKGLIEEYRNKLIDNRNEPIKLSEAYDLLLKKTRKRQASEKSKKQNIGYWRDFVCFINDKYSDVENLSDIRKKHANEYVQLFRTEGRWNKTVKYGSEKSYTKKVEALSARTCNYSLMVLKEVFTKLYDDAGLLENPFSDVERMSNDAEPKDIFTEADLIKIRNTPDSFVSPMFAIGTMTGMREGDICTLKWNEIDFEDSVIKRVMRKTSNKRIATEIPIMPTLYSFFHKLKSNSENSEYVLPEHAQMYLKNPSGVSWRIKKYLQSIGIETSKQVKGRSRKAQTKNFHSLRHTFCYLAGIQGIPLNIVQSIVGHMSLEMTQHYTAHSNRKDKRRLMEKLPDFLILSETSEPEREELAKLSKSLPIEVIIKILTYIKESQ